MTTRDELIAAPSAHSMQGAGVANPIKIDVLAPFSPAASLDNPFGKIISDFAGQCGHELLLMIAIATPAHERCNQLFRSSGHSRSIDGLVPSVESRSSSSCAFAFSMASIAHSMNLASISARDSGSL